MPHTVGYPSLRSIAQHAVPPPAVCCTWPGAVIYREAWRDGAVGNAHNPSNVSSATRATQGESGPEPPQQRRQRCEPVLLPQPLPQDPSAAAAHPCCCCCCCCLPLLRLLQHLLVADAAHLQQRPAGVHNPGSGSARRGSATGPARHCQPCRPSKRHCPPRAPPRPPCPYPIPPCLPQPAHLVALQPLPDALRVVVVAAERQDAHAVLGLILHPAQQATQQATQQAQQPGEGARTCA